MPMDKHRKLQMLQELEGELDDGEARDFESMLPKKAAVSDLGDAAEEDGDEMPSLREQLNDEPLYGREDDEDDEMALMRHYSKSKG